MADFIRPQRGRNDVLEDCEGVLGYRFEPGQEITRGAGYRSPAA